MLKSFKSVNGKLKEVVLEETARDMAGRAKICFWIDATQPTAGEVEELSKLTKIPVDELNMCLDEEERPRLEQTAEYSMIVYRAPHIHKETKKQKEETEILTSPIGIFIVKDCVVTVHLHHTRYLEEMIEHSTAIEDAPSFAHKIIAQITSRYFKIINKLDEDIENLEDEIFATPDKATVQKIFETRKTLLFFHKSLTANREVLVAIEKGYIPQIDKKTREKFRDLYTETIQLIDMASTYREILTGAIDIYRSALSNSTNAIMKTLTVVIAALLLPILLATLYYTNSVSVAGIPGIEIVLVLMIVSVAIVGFYARRKQWI